MNYISKCVFLTENNILEDYIDLIKQGYVNIATYNKNYEQIFDYLKENFGSNDYLDCEYGRLLFNGLGCKEDRIKAHDVFLKLSEKNIPLAQYYLSLSFNCDRGVKHNYILSNYYAKKAYDNGCFLSAYGVGFYLKTKLVYQIEDDETAMYYLMIAICNGSLKAIETLNLSRFNFKKIDDLTYKQTISYLEKEIENGNKMAHIAKALFYNSVCLFEDDIDQKIFEEYSKAPQEFYGFGYEKMSFLKLPIGNNIANIDEFLLYLKKAALFHNKSAIYNLIFIYLNKAPSSVFLKEIIEVDVDKSLCYLNDFENSFKLTIHEKYQIGGLYYDIGYIDKSKVLIKDVYDEAFKALKDKSYPNRFSIMKYLREDGEDGYFAKFNLVTAFNKQTLGIVDEIKCPYCNKKLVTIERKTFFGKKIICVNCKKEIKN